MPRACGLGCCGYGGGAGGCALVRGTKDGACALSGFEGPSVDDDMSGTPAEVIANQPVIPFP